MFRNESDKMPHGTHCTDGDFTIGEVKTIDGRSIFGVIWYAGGEAWAWTEYGAALCHARNLAERQELRRRGLSRSGIRYT